MSAQISKGLKSRIPVSLSAASSAQIANEWWTFFFTKDFNENSPGCANNPLHPEAYARSSVGEMYDRMNIA